MTEEKDKNLKPENEEITELQNIEEDSIIDDTDTENEEDHAGEKIASTGSSNTHLRRLISSNYIEYSSYVIKERAIPRLKDGLKPVQRRILWSLFRMDDGKFHKVANIVGHTMQYHPHGDASIYGALVNLANKEYFIDRQGNFGNIFTGDAAAAARYIEARLTPLGREVMFNPDITEFVDSYDGRNREPVYLPAKVPALLMVGQEGIAPGMTTMILPHNFRELLEAQIAVLRKKEFTVYPDFLQGGIMDVSEYNDGLGKVTLRAKVDIEGRKLIIREIPAYTTTEKLITSIEKAVNKNKIKLASISDYTAESVEVELIPARGYNPEKALKALYTYTDCSMSVSSSILLIKDNLPVMMTVSEIVRECTVYLVEYLRTELQLELDRLNERYHERTLERIFIENRIYKRIEECETYVLVKQEVFKGLEPFIIAQEVEDNRSAVSPPGRNMDDKGVNYDTVGQVLLKREVNDKDIERLLAIPIRRISKFDINKNKEETENILAAIKEVEKNLRHIIRYTIGYIEGLIKKYAVKFERRTLIKEFEEIDKKAAALNNIKVGWDRKNCYIGESIRSEEIVTCNEYNHLICIEKSGSYKVIAIPQKVYVGRLYYFNKYSKNNVYSVIYKEKKNGAYFVKRCKVSKFIRDKEYKLIPKGCQLEQLTIRDNSIYECKLEKSPRQKIDKVDVDFSQVQMRSPGARGFKITDKKIKKISFTGFAENVEEVEISEDENTEIVENGNVETQHPASNNAAQASSLSVENKNEDLVEEEYFAPSNVAQASRLSVDVEAQNPASIKEKKNVVQTSNQSNEKKEVEAQNLASIKENEKDNDEHVDDEEWGIIQPDLGF